MKNFFSGLLTVVFCFVLFGCSKPPEGNVSGKASYKGATLDTGSVLFTSPDKKNFSGGDIGPDGGYRLTAPLPPGEYFVSVVPPALTPDQADGKVPVPKWPVPEKYGEPDNGIVKRNVDAGENTIDIELE